MYAVSLLTIVLLVLPFSHVHSTSTNSSETNSYINQTEVEAIYSMLRHPHDCHLTLICLVQADADLRESAFMSGIKYLANQTDTEHAHGLAFALGAGSTGGDCSQLSSDCTLTEEELMDAIEEMNINPASNEAKRVRRDLSNQRQHQQIYQQPAQIYKQPGQLQEQPAFQNRRQDIFSVLNKRRQSAISNMPPFVRPVESRFKPVCRTCDSRRTVCSVYSIGTYVGCAGVWLVSGIPGQIACNVMTTPGSIGCGINTMNCYMKGCGLVDIPDEVRNMLRNNNSGK
jgi:hypothetical protein